MSTIAAKRHNMTNRYRVGREWEF